MALSILLVRALVEGLEQLGVTREAFLRDTGLDARTLADSEARIGLEQYDALVLRAIAASGDEALGLRMGELASVTAYSVVAHLVAHSSTLRVAIDALVRYNRLLVDRPVYSLRESAETATLAYEVHPSAPVCRRFHAELTMTGFARMVSYFGRGAKPLYVSFEHPAPEDRDGYARIFEGRERFEQSFTGVTFERALLDAPQLHADAELKSALEAQAERRLERQDRATYGSRVHEYLVACVGPDRRDMDATAKSLGISARSLRRRLAEEGATFSDVVSRARATLAKKLLSETNRTIEDIADELGFSDRRAFYRAFKRWTQLTPNTYRRRGENAKAG